MIEVEQGVVQEVQDRWYGQPLRSEDFILAATELEQKIEGGEFQTSETLSRDEAKEQARALVAWLRSQAT